jgi:hypothetical protein
VLLQGAAWENTTVRHALGRVNATLDYSLSFGLKVRGAPSTTQWESILHVGDEDAQRMPALWWKTDGTDGVHELLVCDSVYNATTLSRGANFYDRESCLVVNATGFGKRSAGSSETRRRRRQRRRTLLGGGMEVASTMDIEVQVLDSVLSVYVDDALVGGTIYGSGTETAYMSVDLGGNGRASRFDASTNPATVYAGGKWYTPAVPNPSTVPTPVPTLLPSLWPTISHVPTSEPTHVPTKMPTLVPSPLPSLPPTLVPTRLPTLVPSPLPSLPPTLVPTRLPTLSPTPHPSRLPTAAPTRGPTPVPSLSPSRAPTPDPTRLPSPSPASAPTALPSPVPTQPSPVPSMSLVPTTVPSALPTVQPTVSPAPTMAPSALPTGKPSRRPIPVPTAAPTPTPVPTKHVPPTKAPSIESLDGGDDDDECALESAWVIWGSVGGAVLGFLLGLLCVRCTGYGGDPGLVVVESDAQGKRRCFDAAGGSNSRGGLPFSAWGASTTRRRRAAMRTTRRLAAAGAA